MASVPESLDLEKQLHMKRRQGAQVSETLRTHLIKLAEFFKVQTLWNGAAAELTTGIRHENRPGPATHKPEPRREQAR